MISAQSVTNANLDERWVGVPPYSFFDRTRRAFIEPEERPKFERDRTAFLCDMFYRGKHRVFLSRLDGWWKESTKKSIFFPENYFGYLVDSNVREITRSRVEFIYRAGKDSANAEWAARAASSIVQYYQRQLFTEEFRQGIARRAQLHSTVGVYVWWDSEAGPTKTEPITQTSMVKPAPDAYSCEGCGASGPADSLIPAEQVNGTMGEMAEGQEPPATPGTSLCPDCGSDQVGITEVPEIPVEEQIGEQTRPLGDVRIEPVPIYEITVNGGARGVKSGLICLERDRAIDRGHVESKFPGRPLKVAQSADGRAFQSRGRDYQRRLEGTFGGTQNDRTGTIDDSQYRNVELTETWLLPEAYADYRASSDMELFPESGLMIRAGQRLTELFPNGLKITRSGETHLEWRDEDLRRHWRFFKFKQFSESFWGRGVEDGIALQIMLNEVNSLLVSNLMTNEMPTTLVNSLIIKNLEALASPSKVISYETIPEGVSPDLIFKQFPGTPLNASAYGFPTAIKQSMQNVFGAFSVQSGEAGAENMKTATAWSVAQDNALAAAAVFLGLLAEGYLGVIEAILDLYRENATEERTVEIEGDYALIEQVTLSGADIPVDLEVAVKPGSYMPRQEFQRRDDWNQYYEWEGNYIATHGGPPPPGVAADAEERYGVTAGGMEHLIGARVAKMNLEAVREQLPQIMQMLPMLAEARLANVAMQAEQAVAQAGEIAAHQQEVADSEGTPAPMMPAPPDPAMAVAQAEAQLQTPDGIASLIEDYLQQAPGAKGKIRVQPDKHVAMATWIENYLNTDKGLEEDPIISAWLQLRIANHYAAMAEQTATRQGPMAMVQQQLMGPAQGPGGEEDSSGEKPSKKGPQGGPNRDKAREKQGQKPSTARKPSNSKG